MKFRLFFFVWIMFSIDIFAINVLFEDMFDSYAPGTFPNNPAGVGAAWIGPFEEVPSGWSNQVSNALSVSGANSLFMDKTNNAGRYIRSIADFSQSTERYLYIDYRVRIGAGIPPVYPCAIIKYVDNAGKIAVQISFNDNDSDGSGHPDDDNMFYYSAGVAIDSLYNYSLNTWYHVRIIADQTSKTYDIYVDDLTTPVVAGVPYFDPTAGNIDEVWFELEATAPTVYFDNVQIFENTQPPTADTVPPQEVVIRSSNPLLSYANPIIDVDFYDDVAGDLHEVRYKINNNTLPFSDVVATNISGRLLSTDWQIDQAYWDSLPVDGLLTIYFFLIDDGSNYLISTQSLTLVKSDIIKQEQNVTITNNVIRPDAGEVTTLYFELETSGQVLVQVHTLDGKLVNTLYRGNWQAGKHRVEWNGKNVSGHSVSRGLYFIRINAPEIDQIRKVMVVR